MRKNALVFYFYESYAKIETILTLKLVILFFLLLQWNRIEKTKKIDLVYYLGLQRVWSRNEPNYHFMCSQILGGGHNIHYDINLEGTLGVKKNLISKKKKFGKGGA